MTAWFGLSHTDETQNINTVKHDYSEVPETKDLKHY